MPLTLRVEQVLKQRGIWQGNGTYYNSAALGQQLRFCLLPQLEALGSREGPRSAAGARPATSSWPHAFTLVVRLLSPPWWLATLASRVGRDFLLNFFKGSFTIQNQILCKMGAGVHDGGALSSHSCPCRQNKVSTEPCLVCIQGSIWMD